MNNLNERISTVEARQLLQIVTPLARSCAFTKFEFQQIAGVCNNAIDRLESEVQNEKL